MQALKIPRAAFKLHEQPSNYTSSLRDCLACGRVRLLVQVPAMPAPRDMALEQYTRPAHH